MSSTAYTIRDIPSDLWRQVKSQAALEGVTIRQFILDALRERTNREEEVTMPHPKSIDIPLEILQGDEWYENMLDYIEERTGYARADDAELDQHDVEIPEGAYGEAYFWDGPHVGNRLFRGTFNGPTNPDGTKTYFFDSRDILYGIGVDR